MYDTVDGQLERFPQISKKMADEMRQSRARLYTYLRRYIYLNFGMPWILRWAFSRRRAVCWICWGRPAVCASWRRTASGPERCGQTSAATRRRRGSAGRTSPAPMALTACGGNRTEAANYLGIARRTLYRNMERLHITTD